MIIGIMQPYFFPYLGYFELIERTDRWVVFDVVQYKAKSWMNRNRILHPTRGWHYIGVPVQKTPRGTLIRDVRVKNMDFALTRILGQINHYRKRAPYFCQVENLIQTAFNSVKSDRLVDLNVATLDATCSYLGIAFDWSLCSEMNLDLEGIEYPGQWALRIATQLDAKEYLNPPGGRDIFDKAEWDTAGIDLQFTDMPQIKYDCSPYEFIAHLSILDVLMWNAPEVVRVGSS
jgi:hypothetical protein